MLSTTLLQAVCDNLAAQADLLPLLHQLETSSSAAVSVVPLAETLLEELVSSGGASCRGGDLTRPRHSFPMGWKILPVCLTRT